MSPGSFIFQEILRGLVLRLVLMMGAVGSRREGLVARLAGMRVGHRHHRRLTRELAKAERYEALMAEPGFWECAGAAGKAAEVARVMADAGRRARVRRMVWPRRVRRLRGLMLAWARLAWFGRCIGAAGCVRGPPL